MRSDFQTAASGNRAIKNRTEDKLGFGDIAERISTSLIDHASDQGFVIGIEGSWGSGKSSLLRLIEDELRKLPEDIQPTVINFSPWLIGDRDALLTSFFSELAKKISDLAAKAEGKDHNFQKKAKRTYDAIKKFAVGIGNAGSLVEIAGDASSIPGIKLLGTGMRKLATLLKREPEDTPLDELKENLTKSLRDLGHRFIIAIDDVDRLEPTEAIEVLRLARSVADFPNVTYLLCYDRKILSHSIQAASNIQDGSAYLEKIIQLTAMVPQPEPFQLRQWFSDELYNIARVKNDDELSRLKSVIDHEGGLYLNSPRSVVRAIDAIKFFWPPLRDEQADLADLVWLQLIKNGNTELYRWIEEYCATASVIALGIGHVTDAELEKQTSALNKAAGGSHFNDDSYRFHFAEQLPGLEVTFKDTESGFQLHRETRESTRNNAIENGRLSSPDHYRLYFALAGPSHALTHNEFDAFFSVTEAGARETEQLLLKEHARDAFDSLSKADILLERLKGRSLESLTNTQRKNLLIALSNSMDQAYHIHTFDVFWSNSIWDRAEKLAPALLSELDDPERQVTLEKMFLHGKAISWLTTLLRSEVFAHGRHGERRRNEQEWILSELELDKVIEFMLKRYKAMPAPEILDTIFPLNILFAWRQAGDEDGPRKMLQQHIQSDEGLVEALESLSGKITSSDRGTFNVLRRESLTSFLDYENARKRIENLQNDVALGERARRILTAFKDAESY